MFGFANIFRLPHH